MLLDNLFASLVEENNESEQTHIPTLKQWTNSLSKPRYQAIETIIGHSPFLTSQLSAFPDVVFGLGDLDWQIEAQKCINAIDQCEQNELNSERLRKNLRQKRRRLSLIASLADLSAEWTAIEVSEWLSRFAERAISTALSFHIHEAIEKNLIALNEAQEHGLFILGMGKLGGCELNYSSDIDLIAFYEPETATFPGRYSERELWPRIVKDLANTLQERTVDGFTFRVDLRLRPDPSATPNAIPVEAAENYYQSVARTWERAAFIKARFMAGDAKASTRFLKNQRPFIWRRSLDFVALEEIRKLKLQIDDTEAKKLPRDSISPLAGLNIKLGRGGIREIEFFAQSHQLLWGGRQPGLRTIGTLDSLSALQDAQLIDERCRDELHEAYSFFRLVEHRLQMKEDHQTHTLPSSQEELEKTAEFCGFAEFVDFEETLEGYRTCVKAYYNQFVAGINRSSDAVPKEDEQRFSSLASIIVTPDGVERAGQILSESNFEEAGNSALIIEGWLQGRYRVLKTDRSRQVIATLLPSLLATIAEGQEPDRALAAFDRLLERLPSGLQLFTLLSNNPALQSLLIEILASAPQLAERLSTRPALLDVVLEPGFFDGLPPQRAMKKELDSLLSTAFDYEDSLSIIRRWKNDKVFQASLHILRSVSMPQVWAPWLASVAELVISSLAKLVAEEFEQKHGRFDVVPNDAPALGLAVIAFGKLGERIMSPGSDLDLVFVAPNLDPNEMSNGLKPLAAQQYFGRLAQRLISAITAPTSEGVAYEVDMRLRPSGSKGPLAVSLSGFERYHNEQAWTWEHMSLTRSRVILADDQQKRDIQNVISDVLKKPRNPRHLVQDVDKMKTRIFANRESFDLDIKSLEGGLVSLEFIVQFLHLSVAEKHPDSIMYDLPTFISSLPNLSTLTEPQSRLLSEAWYLYVGLQAVVRLSTGPKANYEDLANSTKSTLASVFGEKDLENAQAKLQLLCKEIAQLYNVLIAEEATKASESDPVDEGPVWNRLENKK
jgi:[glutamine synthetase] adenylyltransferase / [glutamine synthetase]-adenylyl-L-tyrosine phosphorylase